MFGQKVVNVSSNIFSRNVEVKTELKYFLFSTRSCQTSRWVFILSDSNAVI